MNTINGLAILWLCLWDNQAALNCPLANPFEECTKETLPNACIQGTPDVVAAKMPVNYTVALFADAGMDPLCEDVLRLMRAEGAQLVLHGGDIAYEGKSDGQPRRWLDMVQRILGDTSYIAVMGNHDNGLSGPGWGVTESYQAISTRINPIGKCQGWTGVKQVCTMNGITVVFVAPGVVGTGHSYFIAEAFKAYPSRWRICVWHKNMALMQAGTKSDEVGWPVYEECRRHGALILTGHEHIYARSFEMSSFIRQKVSSFESSRLSPTRLRVERNVSGITGTSMVMVVGTGGFSLRQLGDTSNNPWWASALSYDQGLEAGTAICKFNLNGDEGLAYCYYKDPTRPNVILDEWYIRTDDPLDTANEEVGIIEPVFIQTQVENGDDDMYFYQTHAVCNTPFVLFDSLNTGGTVESVLGMLRFTDVQVNRQDMGSAVAAYISW